jgi:hypothetical protein
MTWTVWGGSTPCRHLDAAALRREAADSLWLIELPQRARLWLSRSGGPTISLSDAAMHSRDQAIETLGRLREPAIAVACDGILADLLRIFERAQRVRMGAVDQIAAEIETEQDLFTRRVS